MRRRSRESVDLFVRRGFDGGQESVKFELSAAYNGAGLFKATATKVDGYEAKMRLCLMEKVSRDVVLSDAWES